jgi:hypothetical protein
VNPYWTIAQHRAAEYSLAHARPDAPLTAGLPVLAAHAADFTPVYTLHIAAYCLSVIVFEDCPPHLRTRSASPT